MAKGKSTGRFKKVSRTGRAGGATKSVKKMVKRGNVR